MKHVGYDESVCWPIEFDYCWMKRNPTILKPPEDQKALDFLRCLGDRECSSWISERESSLSLNVRSVVLPMRTVARSTQRFSVVRTSQKSL